MLTCATCYVQTLTLARVSEANELLEDTASRMQAVAGAGARVARCHAVTPTPVFPSIGPGLVVPPPALAPTVVDQATASGQIATPQPRRLLPSVAALAGSVAPSQAERSSRQDRKRARLESVSPSPSPTATGSGALGGAMRRSNLVLRSRGLPLRRTNAPPTAAWMSPSSSHGRLASSTVAEITVALAPAAGSSRITSLPRAGRSANAQNERPSNCPAVVTTSVAHQPPHEPIFDMDLDIPLELSPTPPNGQFTPFATPPHSLASGSALSTRFFDDLITGAPWAAVRGDFANAPGTTFSSAGGPITGPSTPPQAQLATTPTPSRGLAQSAADLAAAFVPPVTQAQPIPIPSQAGQNDGQDLGGAANTAILGLHPANPGMGGLAFTPPPVNGFPAVVFSEPDGVFAGLANARVSALTGTGTNRVPAVVLQVHNAASPPPHEVRAITAAIADTIRRITGELNPLVVPPEREWSAVNDRRVNAPITWAVLGISDDAVRRILAQTTWSTTAITLHVYEPAIRIGRFMFVVGGFAHDHNGSVLNAVFAVFVGTVILPTIFALVQTNPQFVDVSAEAAVRAILASLEVRVSTLQNGNLLAAVFCDSPTQSIPRWREWRDTVAAQPFPSPLNSTGIARRTVPCAGCHGGDHPTHLCPFQDVQGWNAPPPGTAWRNPGAALAQGTTGQQPPPPPPPAGGAVVRTRSQVIRRGNQPNSFTKRDFYGGGSGGFGPGGGAPGFGNSGAGAGSSSFV